MDMTRIPRWVYWWNVTEEYPHDVTDDQGIVQLNADSNMSTMTAQELNAAVAAWQKGAMSWGHPD